MCLELLGHVHIISEERVSFDSCSRLGLRKLEVKYFCCVPDKLHNFEKVIYTPVFLKACNL